MSSPGVWHVLECVCRAFGSMVGALVWLMGGVAVLEPLVGTVKKNYWN
jgi:hypothetical protein